MKEFPRKLRINTQLQREIADLIRETLSDPRAAGVSVTRVDASPDLRNASVYVSSLGSDAELEAAVQVLQKAASTFRHDLGKRLHIRRIPALLFRADKQMREADRLDRLIRSAVSEDAAHARERDPDDT